MGDVDEYEYDCYDDDDDDDDDDDNGDDDNGDCLEEDDGDLFESDSSVKVITKEFLVTAQKDDLSQVMDLLSLKECHARILLIHHRWNVEKVLNALVEKGRDALCDGAGVPMVDTNGLPGSTVSCGTCFEEFSANDVTVMDCGHYFCNECWTEYFTIKINEGQSRHITCMQHKCYAVCDEAKIRRLVSSRDPALAEKFDRSLLESYIEDNRKVKWCPSVPHCGNAIRVDGDEVCEVECCCGFQFCFRCSSEAHSPCSCQMWELWSKKCSDESASVNWLTVYSKPCPKCQKPVEKNGGCNHVTCLCGQYFCWLCGEATNRDHSWDAIVGHSCGRYTDQKIQNLELAKQQLERYIHYYNRYKAHVDSLKLEKDLMKTVQDKIDGMYNLNTDSKNFSWLTDGVARLESHRRVLSRSYAFAFSMFGDDMNKQERITKQGLYEDHQQQFEVNIENLSKALSEDFHTLSVDELADFKFKFVNLYRATDKCCQNLYKFIESDLLDDLKFATLRISPYELKIAKKMSSSD